MQHKLWIRPRKDPGTGNIKEYGVCIKNQHLVLKGNNTVHFLSHHFYDIVNENVLASLGSVLLCVQTLLTISFDNTF
jgi:hypothetical protein